MQKTYIKVNTQEFSVTAGKEKLGRWVCVLLQVASMDGSIILVLIYRSSPPGDTRFCPDCRLP